MTIRSEHRAITINDVARAAGVSRAAVSKVIRNASGVSPAMRERVNVAIEELGYRPSLAARAMRGNSYRLGLEIPHIGARFMVQVVEGAQNALAGTPYQLVVAAPAGPEYGAIETLVDGFVDGIVAVSPMVDTAWLENLASRVPVVMLGRHDPAEHYDTVTGDDVVGAREVMRHLYELGHRDIAHVTESDVVSRLGSGTPHALRREAYLDFMADAGLEPQVRTLRQPVGTDNGARTATAELLARGGSPTAIFAGHDDIAIQVLAGIADSGRPRDAISVVGYDNTDFAAHPLISLTSVDQRGVEMGAEAVTMLLERIQGRTLSRHHVVTPTLRIRTSTGPPR